MNKKNIGIAAAFLEKHGYLKKVAGDSFDKACEVVSKMFDTGRGVIVSGSCGVGKSCFCLAAAKTLGCQYFIDMKEPNALGWFTDEEHTKMLLDASVYLDDVGCERVVNNYGDKIEVLCSFIERYHSRRTNEIDNKRLYISTNLFGGDFTKRYTARVTDRLLEICIGWKMEGKSKRKPIIVR